MEINFRKYMLQSLVLVLAMWLSICHARPAEGNYDMIMAYDQEPAQSMQYQDFETFYNAELENNKMSELDMEESQGITYIRPPQPLSEREKQLQESDKGNYDVQLERRKQRSLHKGSTRPRHDGLEWEQLDYDSYIN